MSKLLFKIKKNIFQIDEIKNFIKNTIKITKKSKQFMCNYLISDFISAIIWHVVLINKNN